MKNMLRVILIWLAVVWLTIFATIFGFITGQWGAGLFGALLLLATFAAMIGVFREPSDKA